MAAERMHRLSFPLLSVVLVLSHAGPARAQGGSEPPLPPLVPLPVVEVRPASGVEIRLRPETPTEAASPARLEGLLDTGDWRLRSSVRVSPEDGPAWRVQRLDTGLQLQVPGPVQTLVLGDTLASGGGWSRPVRLGGLRLGRSLTLRPGHEALARPTAHAALPVTPLGFGAPPPPAMARGPGVAAVPVVAPVADIADLAPGAWDYELELGRLRSGWGTPDDRYGPAFMAGAYRRGVGHRTTVEARTEWSATRQAAGVEIAHRRPDGAHLAAVLARSESDGGSGLRTGMRVAGQALGARWRLSWDGFEPDWTPAAAAAHEVQPRSRLRASARADLTRQLSAGLTVAEQSAWNAESERVLALNLRLALPQGSSVVLDLSERPGLGAPLQHRLVLDVPLDIIGR
ncbi:hypothetical protein JI739_16760 [Ramlibacter sp. AW1]|uniref:DUF3570 domain-containing protein n=1 Tax=Ramlibacter aurantiacus TaxID=2801330 RepID=A0A936ZIF6_9BURK|nr:hypothetical protein [Ramlibacter aurantiacus]MBL0422004.1 hypothetical protein [Ramlibacter aurantiacus]